MDNGGMVGLVEGATKVEQGVAGLEDDPKLFFFFSPTNNIYLKNYQ